MTDELNRLWLETGGNLTERLNGKGDPCRIREMNHAGCTYRDCTCKCHQPAKTPQAALFDVTEVTS